MVFELISQTNFAKLLLKSNQNSTMLKCLISIFLFILQSQNITENYED
jgi:hypothetical protein